MLSVDNEKRCQSAFKPPWRSSGQAAWSDLLTAVGSVNKCSLTHEIPLSGKVWATAFHHCILLLLTTGLPKLDMDFPAV